MTRPHLTIGAASTVLGLAMLGSPWVSWKTTSGGELTAGWSEFSPASLSFAAAAAAALAASTLLRGVWLRGVGALQTLLALLGIWLAVGDLLTPDPILTRLTSNLLGIDLGSGNAPNHVSWSAFPVVSTMAALLGLAASGLLTLWLPSQTGTSRTHYERPLPDSEDPWDQLTRGADPTGR